MENLQDLKTDLLLEYLDTGSVEAFNFLNNLGDVSIPQFHYPMLKDENRNKFYEDFISQHAHEKVLLDVGAGAGYLVSLALKHGAKKIYAVENNWAMVAILRHLFKQEILNKQVVVINKDALFLERKDFSELPQVIVQELFSDNGISEGVLNIFSHLRNSQILGSAIVFPRQLKIYAQPVVFTNDKEHFLSSLDPFFKKVVRYKDDNKWTPSGEAVCVWNTDITEFEKKIIVKTGFDFKEESNGIRFWFECGNKESEQILSNDVSKYDSHWANLIYPIPRAISGKRCEVQITFEKNNFKLSFSNIN